MVEKEEFHGEESFACEECGFHYRSKEKAEECEDYCKNEGVCDFDITTKSLERKAIT